MQNNPSPKTQPQLELIPLRPGVSAHRPLPVLLRIHTPEPQERPERPLLNLALVLDRSGSMGGSKLKFAKEAAIYAVHNLLPEDRVAVVIYDNSVEVLVPSTLVGEQRGRIAELIGRICTGGSTALHAGWLEGATQVAAYQETGRLNRVALLSDGLANVGETNPKVITEQVRGLAQRGISTSTLGVGLDYNEDLMTAMAEAGEGNYYFIESPADLPRIFAQELAGLAGTLGIRVRLRLGPQARLLNELEREASGDYVLPSLVAGIPLEFLLELEAPAGPEASWHLELGWETPAGQRERLEATLRLPVLEAAEFERLEAHPEVAAALARLENSKAIRARQRAVLAQYQEKLARLRRELEQIVQTCDPYEEDEEDFDPEQLIRELERLSQDNPKTPSGRKGRK
ncbi:vWA domain-containing protein [Meiothermus taiwanensis]|uniref:Marine proteobacterial sortase target protein n=1 Tax=Meiothermus taiwanensis TaxID=172827 RepID=A0A399DYC2_9DEIN|nr:VWA domain-containing protein [Meiothermus taiwanensis]RIH77177.1 marine proteobacterial sortase target protein [Meiothermus taiwanensis]